MTPDFMIDTLQQELAERAEHAFQSQYLDGFTDADCGRLPTFLDDAYLAGYIAKLRELPTDAIGAFFIPLRSDILLLAIWMALETALMAKPIWSFRHWRSIQFEALTFSFKSLFTFYDFHSKHKDFKL